MPDKSCLACVHHRLVKRWKYLDQPARSAHVCTHTSSIQRYAGEGFTRKTMHGVSCDVARRMPSSVDVPEQSTACGPHGAHWSPQRPRKGRAAT